LNGNQALVTGAHGFLGRHVARTFADHGYTVTGVGHGTWPKSEWQEWGLAEWHPGSITPESLSICVRQPDVVVHCAGSGSVGFSLTHPMQDFERTVSTTLNVLEFLRLHSPKSAFVYPSSAAVYGNAECQPIAESVPPNPISPYGIHKKIAEDLICSYANHFSQKAAIARFFSLYGPGLKKQLLWDACRRIESGDTRFFGTGHEVRDWLHVRDAARLLFMLSAHASPDAPIVNGGTGRGTTVREIVTAILEKMERRDSPRFSQVRKPGDPQGYVADIEKARGFGWRPEIPLEEGIGEYVRWYRSGGP